jgi:hypothetical protein
LNYVLEILHQSYGGSFVVISAHGGSCALSVDLLVVWSFKDHGCTGSGYGMGGILKKLRNSLHWPVYCFTCSEMGGQDSNCQVDV